MASEDIEPPIKRPRTRPRFTMSSPDFILTDNYPEDDEGCYFSSPWHFSDVVLAVEGRKFHVHKSILSMGSPVFEKMFSSRFRERKAKEISLPGKDADEFEVLLKIIYSFKTGQIVTYKNCEFLLKLADEYQMERVKDLCAEHILKWSFFYDSLEVCKIADQYSLDGHIANSISKASKLKMKSIESNPCYSDVSDGLKVQILTKRIKELEELLSKFSSTCSTLVDKAYAAISKKVHDGECLTHQTHSTETVGGVTRLKKFDLNCILCLLRLENKWPEKDALVKYLKGPFQKLRLYKEEYERLNIDCNFRYFVFF